VILARTAAILGAVLAVAMLTSLFVLGAEFGWVVETGLADGVGETYDVRGELPWMTVLTLGVLVGATLAVKLPRHPVPWLLMLVGLGFLGYPTVVTVVAFTSSGDAIPSWSPYVTWFGNWVWIVGQLGAIYLLLVYPDGRTLTARWALVARAGAIYIGAMTVLLVLWPDLEAARGMTNPFGVEALRVLDPALMPLLLGFVLLPLAAVLSLVLRFVRSRGVERAQMKWMAFAVVTLAIGMIGNLAGLPRWSQTIPMALILVAIVIGVTRYRLFEIDRVISRTVSYAVITLLLAGAYVAGVVGLGGIARGLGVGGGDLVVAASTLAVAALFQPLRGRVQGAVDRRFDRAHYDAVRTVDAFGQRLRDQVDLEALSDELQVVAVRCLVPTHTSLLLVRERST
jgi:hypothetical protein